MLGSAWKIAKGIALHTRHKNASDNVYKMRQKPLHTKNKITESHN